MSAPKPAPEKGFKPIRQFTESVELITSDTANSIFGLEALFTILAVSAIMVYMLRAELIVHNKSLKGA